MRLGVPTVDLSQLSNGVYGVAPVRFVAELSSDEVSNICMVVCTFDICVTFTSFSTPRALNWLNGIALLNELSEGTWLTVCRWLQKPAQGSRPAHTVIYIARFFGRSFVFFCAFLCGKAMSCLKLVDIYIRNILTRESFLWAVRPRFFRGSSAKYEKF